MTAEFKPKLYVRATCPFCIKLENFFTDKGAYDKIEIIECDDKLDYYRTFLTEKLGTQATFPTMEIAPDQFMKDSGALMDYYADKF